MNGFEIPLFVAQGIPSSPLYFVIVWGILLSFAFTSLLVLGFGLAAIFCRPRFKPHLAISACVWLASGGLVLLLRAAR